jgi:hypothetical protein
MRRCAAILFAMIALYWTTAPLLACAVPERTMTAQERACCEQMAEMCGSTQMPASHSCCKTVIRADTTIVVKRDQQSIPVLLAIATVPISISAPSSTGHVEASNHHPPGEFLSDTTILRI